MHQLDWDTSQERAFSANMAPVYIVYANILRLGWKYIFAQCFWVGYGLNCLRRSRISSLVRDIEGAASSLLTVWCNCARYVPNKLQCAQYLLTRTNSTYIPKCRARPLIYQTIYMYTSRPRVSFNHDETIRSTPCTLHQVYLSLAIYYGFETTQSV